MTESNLLDEVARLKPHTITVDECCDRLQTSPQGLSSDAVQLRLQVFGPNSLPRKKSAGPLLIFIRQFANPLIYILLIAAVLSLLVREWTDAGFIVGVLLLNALIGAIQEYQAQRSAEALEKLVSLDAIAIRDGVPEQIKADRLVPGDIVLVESGTKVPADVRLLQEHALSVDESLLTGESVADTKDEQMVLPETTPVADRSNMLFGGTMVLKGRGSGVVVATGEQTELGKIASDVQLAEQTVPPLMLRMKTFTTWVGIIYLLVITVIAAIAWIKGAALLNILLIAVALAVAAIPEGLPVAITVALAVGMSRMAKSNVIIRRLIAAEALGSCTMIASDKTGTLTVNRLTTRCVRFPGCNEWLVTGEGTEVSGEVSIPDGQDCQDPATSIERLARIAVFCNEASMYRRKQGWEFRGDTVDIALMIFGWKVGVRHEQLIQSNPLHEAIPYESEQMYAASLNALQEGGGQISVKGAAERVIPMCSRMLGPDGEQELDVKAISQQVDELAAAGYRVLALADKRVVEVSESLSEKELQEMCFVGLVGLIDPPRPEAKQAIKQCRHAGVSVVMVTGDHPITALAIAQQLGLAQQQSSVVTGSDLANALQQSQERFHELVLQSSIFARIDPRQKLQIVQALREAGHFVAVTGDGANDAPALRAAHVGVAMGKQGTDIARESSELIITDDNFASLVAGIREGRIAYANVRKVIFLLISTGAVEIVAFILSLLAGLPLPLTAIQLLWLNLVTEGIQDVALAFEPGEGNEMNKPPRPPNQPIFDRLMIERVVISAVTMGALAFIVFWYQYSIAGASLETSRNIALLFLVMFENIQVFNSRSETVSILKQPFFSNRLLLIGTLAAQAIHIAALYTPGLSDLLDVQPVSLNQWLLLMTTALILLLVMELHKWWWARRPTTASA
ncbi:MAG: cation-translocating P-type ATPase [Acidiferrobacterales bacterium]